MLSSLRARGASSCEFLRLNAASRPAVRLRARRPARLRARLHARFPAWRLAAAFLPLSAAVLLAGCGGKAASATVAPAPAAPNTVEVTADAGATIALATLDLQPQPFSVSVSAPGTVRSNQDATALVGPVIEGRICKVLATWGQAVKAGEVLAMMDSVAVGEAKAAHLRAGVDLSVAESTLKRMQTLATGKIVATKDLLAAEADRTTAQAEAEISGKSLQLMGFSAEDVARFDAQHDLNSQLPLLAPIDGTVVDRTAVVGAWAGPSAPLFTLMDLGKLWVDAQVYEKDLAAVKGGMEVSVSVVAWPDRTFTGQVSYIGSTVDEATRTTIVRTVVDNPEGLLKPGMYATVRVRTRDTPQAMVLPEGAVLQSPGAWQVVVAEAGHYRLRDVKVGVTANGLTEIVGGLTFGERVVTSGHNQIAAELAALAGTPAP